jgi:hypothetical protein
MQPIASRYNWRCSEFFDTLLARCHAYLHTACLMLTAMYRCALFNVSLYPIVEPVMQFRFLALPRRLLNRLQIVIHPPQVDT